LVLCDFFKHQARTLANLLFEACEFFRGNRSRR
jgi:hypothetical protein